MSTDVQPSGAQMLLAHACVRGCNHENFIQLCLQLEQKHIYTYTRPELAYEISSLGRPLWPFETLRSCRVV